MWTVCITSIRHVLKLNGYGGRQAKANEKRQRFKGWETLVIYFTKALRILTRSSEKTGQKVGKWPPFLVFHSLCFVHFHEEYLHFAPISLSSLAVSS